MEKQNKKLITHNGSFHTDDIFATVALSLILEKENQEFEIIRTRDPEIIKTGDYVFDVGSIYDEATNRFDHHQVGGAGKGVSTVGQPDIEYSSFGLVWKKFGAELCGSQKVADIVNRKLVSPIDAHDNGMDLTVKKYDISPYDIQNFFYSMVPTWRESANGRITNDQMFLESVKIARIVLLREIIHAKDFALAEENVIAIYKNSQDKRIVILDKNYPWEYTLNSFPEPLFVVYPRTTDNTWGVKAVQKGVKTFENRKNLPKFWSGLKDEELQKITEVPDAVFCHRTLFMAVAKSKEGAIKLAELALLEPKT